MGYLKIQNLYSDPLVLLLRECYALEKIHGTSAYVRYRAGQPLLLFPGGEKLAIFESCFNREALHAAFVALGYDDVIVYGEAYGGRQQGMRATYGNRCRFIAFDVRIGFHGPWLAVPAAENVVQKLGLEFVAYERGPCTLEWLNEQRDRPSVQAQRNGCGDDKTREGIVVRPLIELTRNNGSRLIAKHKNEAFCETKSKRELAVGKQPAAEKALCAARAAQVAQEWATPMRLAHVLDKLLAARSEAEKERGWGMQDTGAVLQALVADVEAEAGDQVAWTQELRRAISREGAMLYKRLVQPQAGASK